MTVSFRLILAIVLMGAACGARREPRKLSVAAAADLSFAMEEASREFRARHPNLDLQVAYGSSGNYFAQIQSGAPFDVFLSADVEYPRKLAAAGIGAKDSIFTYAAGRLAVWVPANSRLDPATALHDPTLKLLAIANPQHAPYGRAAEAALGNMGVWDTVRSRLVLGENVAQTLQFVQSGAAEAGVVALSLALAPAMQGQGRYWEIPLDSYPRIDQGGMILKDSADARELRAFLLSGDGRRILKRYGFYLPNE